MFTYFRYLSKVIFSKIPLWLIVAIGYIFAIVFLIVVPAFTKTSPILMWNFDLINIQTTFITIEAVKSVFERLIINDISGSKTRMLTDNFVDDFYSDLKNTLSDLKRELEEYD